MPVLTGDFGDLLAGNSVLPKITSLYVETNIDGAALVDSTANIVRLGKRYPLSQTDGLFSVTLPSTAATDLGLVPNTLRYQVVARFNDLANGQPEVWRSGWFELTADGNVADLATTTTAAVAQWTDAFRDDMEALKAETEAARDAAVAPTADQVAAVDADPASAFRVQQDARHKATYVPHAGIGYSTTKKAAFSFGGSGTNGTTTSFDDTVQRLPLRIPVTSARWRMHVSNRDYRNGGGYAGPINGLGCWVGEHALDANGDWTGGFVEAAPAQAFGAWTVGAAASSEFISAWVTDPAHQLVAHRPQLLSLGWTTPVGTTKVRGIGAQYVAQGVSGQAGRQAAFAGSFLSNTALLDVWVEYEAATANPVALVLGDSLSEGNSSGRGPLGSWPFQHSMLNGDLFVSNAYTGSTTANFTDPAATKWTRFDGIAPDYAVVAVGSNDVSSAVALATIQANLRTIYANLRTKYGRAFPIYVATIAPRGFTGATETTRVDLNKWLRNLPAGVAGCFDFDKAVQSPTDATILDPEFNSGDGIHMTVSGYGRLARAVPGRITRY